MEQGRPPCWNLEVGEKAGGMGCKSIKDGSQGVEIMLAYLILFTRVAVNHQDLGSDAF